MDKRTIITIVEGPGEVSAIPILVSKLVNWDQYTVHIPRPLNAHGKDNLIKPGGLERFLELARRNEECNGVLVLIDADSDCPRTMSIDLASRAAALGLPFSVTMVCAKCEYEAWFIASLETVQGNVLTDITMGTSYDGDVESIRNAKGWLTRQMPSGRIYKETHHQALMTNLLDPNLVRVRSRSFQRLEHAILELLSNDVVVTPREKPS